MRVRELIQKKEFLAKLHEEQLRLVNEELRTFLKKKVEELKGENPGIAVAKISKEIGLTVKETVDLIDSFGIPF